MGTWTLLQNWSSSDSSAAKNRIERELNFHRGVPPVKRSSPFVIYSIFIRQSALWRIKAWSYASDSRVLYSSLPLSSPLRIVGGCTVATFNENSSALSFRTEQRTKSIKVFLSSGSSDSFKVKGRTFLWRSFSTASCPRAYVLTRPTSLSLLPPPPLKALKIRLSFIDLSCFRFVSRMILFLIRQTVIRLLGA